MSKLFDFEQKLMDFCKVTDDLDLIDVTNSDPHKTQMLLSSIRNVYQAKSDVLLDCFEELTKEFYNGRSNDKTTSE